MTDGKERGTGSPDLDERLREERVAPYEPLDDPAAPHETHLADAWSSESRGMAWHNPSYLVMLVGQFISLTGTHMSTLALPWFVLLTSGKASMMGVLLATAIPYAAFALVAGALVDKFNTKRLMIVLDVARGLITVLIPVLAMMDRLEYWHILVVAALSSTLATPYQGARLAIVPDLVGESERNLTVANTALQLSMQLTSIFGPVLAGILIVWIGKVNVLFVDAATYFIAAALFAFGVRYRPAVHVHEEHHWVEEVRSGISFIWHNNLIRIGIIVGMFTTMGLAMMISAALPVFVVDVLKRDSSLLGYLLGTWGAGASVGMIVYGSMADRWPFRRGPSINAFMTLMALPLFIPPATGSFALSLVAFGLSGLFGGPIGIIVNTIMQTDTPAHLRGRVFSAFQALILIATPVGLLIAAPVLTLYGALPIMWATAVLFSVIAAAMWFSKGIRDL